MVVVGIVAAVSAAAGILRQAGRKACFEIVVAVAAAEEEHLVGLHFLWKTYLLTERAGNADKVPYRHLFVDPIAGRFDHRKGRPSQNLHP